MIRISEYPIHNILSNVVIAQRGKKTRKKDKRYLEWNEHKVRMDSLRLKTFANYGTQCVKCGIKGRFFALEKHHINASRDVAHFNLYAFDDRGHEVLMTRDHVIPKSRGGRNFLGNMQPMCCKCNNEKGDRIGD